MVGFLPFSRLEGQNGSGMGESIGAERGFSEKTLWRRWRRARGGSLADDGKTLWVHKLVRGVKCRQSVELDLYYDPNRRLTNSEVSGGALVTEADYDEWTARQDAPHS
jgi:hypothetical protein